MRVKGREGQIDIDEYAQRLAAALVGSIDIDRTREVPSPEQVADRIGDLLIDVGEAGNEIAALLAPFWSAQRARAALGGPSRAALASRRAAGTLLGLKTTDGVIVYPVSQFERHAGQVRVKPGLKPFMTALKRHSPWSVALLIHTPAPELGGVSPLDWVRRDGDTDTLRAYANRVDAEWSR